MGTTKKAQASSSRANAKKTAAKKTAAKKTAAKKAVRKSGTAAADAQRARSRRAAAELADKLYAPPEQERRCQYQQPGAGQCRLIAGHLGEHHIRIEHGADILAANDGSYRPAGAQ